MRGADENIASTATVGNAVYPPLGTTASAILTGLNNPEGMAFDSSGNLFVGNVGGNTVSKFAPSATAASATLTGLSEPTGLAFDARGNLYVANYTGTTVSMFSRRASRRQRRRTSSLPCPRGR